MATTYLSKTLPASDEGAAWTFSTWVKRGNLTTTQCIISAGTASNTRFQLYFGSGDAIGLFVDMVGTSSTDWETTAKYRDPGAWYHIVLNWNGSAIALYVNGVQVTEGVGTTTGDGSNKLVIGTNIEHKIGAIYDGSWDFTGSMAHTHFCAENTYTASSFGEFDATSGVWVPKTGPSVTYGTNGFFLKYQDTTNFGDDSSGNENDFTVTAGTMTQTKDNPNNNFASMTPLNASAAVTLSNANTTVFGNTTSSGNVSVAICPDTGKWYAECKYATIVSNYPRAGVFQLNDRDFGRVQNSTAGAAGEATNGVQYSAAGAMTTGGSETGSWGSAVSAGGIVQLAIDSDNGAIYIGVNNTWQNSGVPTSGATRTGAATTWTPGPPPTGDSTGTAFGDACYNGSYSNWNFGNGYFGTTAVTSAEADGNGEGQFEYAPPTGYFALCTNNLGSES